MPRRVALAALCEHRCQGLPREAQMLTLAT